MLPSHASQIPIATATQVQACIIDKPMSSVTQSSTHGEFLGKGETPVLDFLATKSQEESPLRHGQKELHSNIKEEGAEASTRHRTQVAANSTNLSKQNIRMKPL